MAKTPTSKGGTAKVRFVMLEAEITDGDLSQITQVIQNAFKAPTTVVHHNSTSGEPKVLSVPVHSISKLEEDGTPGEEVYDAQNVTPPKQDRPLRVRRPTTPNVVNIDLASDVSWNDFANSHELKSDVDRYLVVAVWFKEHRAIDAVSADHVYTCFRAVGWSTAIDDFSGPLRSLKKNRLVGPGPNRGEYAVNHLGIAKIAKLRRA